MENIRPALSGFIQQFGSLIVLDFDFQVTGVSDNVIKKLDQKDCDAVLGSKFDLYFSTLFGKQFSKINQILENIRDKKYPRQILPIKLDHKRIYLKLSLHHDHLFIEWEEQFKKYTSAKKINEFSFLLDTIQPNNWDRVCHGINRILHYDHVFVVQIQETGYSQVIAEDNLDGKDYYRNMEFSKSFMPKDVFLYYSMCSYRYSPNLQNNCQQFYSTDPEINLLESQLAPVPQLHRLFLSEKEVTSALFFSIHVDGQFWGLLIGHHHEEKNIDLQQRKLCTFMIQNATSKYENYLKQDLLERNKLLKDAEINLKIDLLKYKTANCALVQHMETIMDMVGADGLAIFNQGDVYFQGNCPSKAQLYEIITFIQAHTEKALFKDNNFRESHGAKIKGQLPFAGLMYLKIGLINDQILIWFRKETVSNVLEMQVNAATDDINAAKQIKLTEKVNYDIATPWNDVEVSFVLRLNQILKESIVGKLKDKQQWSEQLLALNNELEMLTFTLSHDLKNPLSILKMGIQFLQNSKESLNPTALEKWYSNLIASTESIENIINGVVLLAQRKTGTFTKDPIPMAYSLDQIYKEHILLHNPEASDIQYGRLLPIWGEKSALYQIFSNVIGNAIKYSPGTAGVKLHIDSYFEDEQVCYKIKDQGIGIPKENLHSIFEIFKRGKNVDHIEGTGVGLSLVKRIMERLGGTIKIDSEEEKGTTVYLYFPIVEEFPPSMLLDDL
ncbi:MULTISPECIES: ATP-binding protein [unclassified Sphingobacterium]|uniref:ATP-binding protein n=1 Tax=unclassified Sphingobacterium TaxID=2609468 RepID=UPI001050BEC6|nr:MULTISPECIES: ATP-binding protein [unclassified Sphingobacterium]MCS3552797.1 light-regulated signal transduction histidine kinase (bacteriophytochrome) [Sphingobacterium sp. JUb21]TCR10447.1 light-regulated signal transduction histidine kinase (bacteriophytochrome) [Sphingobacterium sp. JUb20]